MNGASTSPPSSLKMAEGTIVLVGTPPVLSGIVRIANTGDEKLKVKSLPVHFAATGKEYAAAARSELQVQMRLAPGATAQAPVSVEIDGTTPPGTYHGEADLGNERRAVVLHVLEKRAVSVLPSTFDLTGAPGVSIALPVVITNLGNVPFTPPKVALIALGERDALQSLFHVAMAKKGAEGHTAMLDAYSAMVAATEVDPAKALLRDDSRFPLAAGDSVATEITFELPSRLAKNRTYAGSFSVGRAQCTVEIEVEGGANARVSRANRRNS